MEKCLNRVITRFKERHTALYDSMEKCYDDLSPEAKHDMVIYAMLALTTNYFHAFKFLADVFEKRYGVLPKERPARTFPEDVLSE